MKMENKCGDDCRSDIEIRKLLKVRTKALKLLSAGAGLFFVH